MIPNWLYLLAWISLAVAFACTIVIVTDIAFGHPQKMWIMNVVWPVTALYAGPLSLWAYYRYGRLSVRGRDAGQNKSFPAMVGLGTTHCGAGCTLGDLCAEWLVFATGLMIFPLPNHKHLFASWILAYVFAYTFGIAFQYFTIAPMRNLSVGEGIWAAIKADTLSLTAWQIGMYGWMAIVAFLIFGREIEKTNPVFWFMMQIAMLWGFLTSYPVNWWLLRVGLKERM